MVLVSPYDKKYPITLVSKHNVTIAHSLRLKIMEFLTWKPLSGDRPVYLLARKINERSDVDRLTYTKQLLNLFCIVYINEIGSSLILCACLSE